MKFVKGSSFKGCKPTWYLVLDGKDAEQFTASILRGNGERFLRDPHGDRSSVIAAQASMKLAMMLDLGLHDRTGYFVNRRGGMCHTLYGIVERKTSSMWPEKTEIAITRWPGGVHFYVKVDGQDVEWRGQNKWTTESAARDAANHYLQKATRE
jgi:hypothetical protein